MRENLLHWIFFFFFWFYVFLWAFCVEFLLLLLHLFSLLSHFFIIHFLCVYLGFGFPFFFLFSVFVFNIFRPIRIRHLGSSWVVAATIGAKSVPKWDFRTLRLACCCVSFPLAALSRPNLIMYLGFLLILLKKICTSKVFLFFYFFKFLGSTTVSHHRQRMIKWSKN